VSEIPAAATRYAQQAGTELVRAVRLTGGSSASVWRLELLSDDGPRSVVFRQHRPGELKDHGTAIARKEHDLLAELHARGLAVPAPLAVDQRDRSLVMEWIDGGSAVARTELDAALDQSADFLVALHSIDPAPLAPVLEDLEDPLDELAAYLPVEDAPSSGPLRAAVASGRIDRRANPAVVVHGDFWPGNLLWNDGHLVAVIDWEDTCIGDPLADLAGARVEHLCQYGEAAMERFTRRYLHLASPLDLRSLPLWEAYVSATALSSMHLWGLDAEEESRRRSLTTEILERAAQELLG